MQVNTYLSYTWLIGSNESIKNNSDDLRLNMTLSDADLILKYESLEATTYT
jgi:hypothetical protein